MTETQKKIFKSKKATTASAGWIQYTSDEIAKGEFHLQKIKKRIRKVTSENQVIEIVETESYGKALLINNRTQHLEYDEFVYNEIIVHPCMFFLQENCKKILCIGGGPGGVVRECSKYITVEEIFQIEIDKKVIELSEKYFKHISQNVYSNPKVNLVIDNAVSFLNNTKLEFDFIINDLSEPVLDSPAIPFFTKDLLDIIINKLNKEHGIYITWAGSSHPKNCEFALNIFNNIKTKFPYSYPFNIHIQSFGCSWVFVIGSMKPLNIFQSKNKLLKFLKRYNLESLSAYDSETHYNIFNIPKYIRTIFK